MDCGEGQIISCRLKKQLCEELGSNARATVTSECLSARRDEDVLMEQARVPQSSVDAGQWVGGSRQDQLASDANM